MTAQRRVCPPAIAALLAVTLLLLAACGASTASTSASPPPGGPVPAELLGAWFQSNNACALIQLTFTATTYKLTRCGESSSGDVVVNKTEIDFFNADVCGMALPDGVGRYTWTVTAGVLKFTPLISDPCPRGAASLANRSYSRAS
jgi:hypothetical protein